jgi:membrane-associated phospholipid phosphatase
LPLALILLVIGLHFWLVWGGSFPGDGWAVRQQRTPHPAWIHSYANIFQWLGTPLVAIALVAIAMLAILKFGSFREAVGLVVACLGVPLNAVLKVVLGQSPLWRAFHHKTLNFPSGHTTFTVAVVGYLTLLAWRHGRRWLTLLGLLFVVAVGPARVVTGIHLVSDVVAGYLLGAAMLLLASRTAAPAEEPAEPRAAGARPGWSSVLRLSRR